MNSNLYPLKIRYMPEQFMTGSEEKIISTTIDNESYSEIDNVSITIITPSGTSLNIMEDNPIVERFEINNGKNGKKDLTFISHTIPVNLINKINNRGRNITLSTIFLKKIHSYNTYDLRWKFNYKSLIRDNGFPYKFGIIIKIPIFGVSYYQGELLNIADNEYMIRIDPLEKEKIIIESKK